jgi:hypothetical protein
MALSHAGNKNPKIITFSQRRRRGPQVLRWRPTEEAG